MRITILILLVLTLSLAGCSETQPVKQASGQAKPMSGVTISFPFKSLWGFASQQFAVWVENEKGEFVKAVYATKWTTSGGYKKRPNAIPAFVKRSRLADMTQEQIDAFSGATPKTSNLSYTWDLTNAKGEKVGNGKYIVYVEGTLRDANIVIYQGEIEVGGSPVKIQAKPQYSVSDTTDKEMIGSVTIEYNK